MYHDKGIVPSLFKLEGIDAVDIKSSLCKQEVKIKVQKPIRQLSGQTDKYKGATHRNRRATIHYAFSYKRR